MSDLKSMESQLSLEKKIIKKSFLDNFLSSLEVSLIWSGIQLMRSFDFELEIVSQIPDQINEISIELKKLSKKYFFCCPVMTSWDSNSMKSS